MIPLRCCDASGRRDGPRTVAAALAAGTLAVLATLVPAAEKLADLTPEARRAVYPRRPSTMEDEIRRDPLAFLKLAERWHEGNVQGYACEFSRREFVKGKLRPEEVVFLKLREDPLGIYMKWIKGKTKGREAIYAEGEHGGKVVVHPSGLAGILFRKVKIDPESDFAKKHSRRPITKAGMLNQLKVLIPQIEDARDKGELTLTYEGVREVDGRSAYTVLRTLPEGKGWPCHKLYLYIDTRFLVCLRTEAYDWVGNLVSDYVYRDLTINPGLTDHDFDPDNRDYSYRAM